MLKNHLDGKCLADDEEIEIEARKCLRQQPKDFYAGGKPPVLK
jgi:hypothetical protein